MSAAFADDLARALGCPIEADPDVVAAFARDQAPLAPAGTAAVLVRARSSDDVRATLAFANERRIPVVTRGAGTGLAGGANAVDGCILLSVAGLDRIESIDAATKTAVVEPGVLNAKLAAEAEALGLFYPPDPASREISTIGGNVATNAGGACCLKYGVTGDHVAALEVVLADGSTIRTGSLVSKNVAGLDLHRLVIGSEGTLGVIVKVTLRLRKAPRPPSTLVAFFDSIHDGARAIVEMEAASDLSLLEVMDKTTIGAVEGLTHMDLDTDAGALVIAQSDGLDAAEAIGRCVRICERGGARSVVGTDDREEGRLLLAARRMALPALERLGATLLDDVAVPRPALPSLFEAIERVADRHRLRIGTFGHAGDGNLHPTIVFDRANERERAAAAFADIVKHAVELGGTITGEHGVGSLKTDFLTLMVGETERALMRRVKAAFDPRGILNPGKGL